MKLLFVLVAVAFICHVSAKSVGDKVVKRELMVQALLSGSFIGLS